MIEPSQIPSILLIWAESLGLSKTFWTLPRIQWELKLLLGGANDPNGFLDSIGKETYNQLFTDGEIQVLKRLRSDARERLNFMAVLAEASAVVQAQKASDKKVVQLQKQIDSTPKPPTIKPIMTKTLTPNSLAYIIAGSGAISGVLNGRPFSIQADFPNYGSVKEAINKRDTVALEKLINVSRAIGLMSKGVCEVKDGAVLYNGKPLANVMTDRILRLMREGWTFDPMLRFLENLMSNPAQSAIDELYLFLEANAIPITDDGHFLAYKRVSKEFKSKHASPDGTYMDHKIGSKPSMDRDQVDPDRHTTCSRGLHFCSLSYLTHYGSDSGGDKTIIVKVNPRDVCAIPSDYKNAKGRAWTYEVVAEHTLGETVEAFTEPVYSSDGEFGVKPSGQRYYQLRDEKGKFLKR